MNSFYVTNIAKLATSKDLKFFRWAANEVRRISIEATTRSKSGHPTTCMSQAEINVVIRFLMRQDSKDLFHPNRDGLILSKGHGAPADYAAMSLLGYFKKKDIISGLRTAGSKFEGHPTTRTHEAYTGSLGQGLSIGVGEALAGKRDGRDYKVYVLLGDGECHEGSVWEAAMSASKFGLDNLVAVIDRNMLAQAGRTDEEMPLKPFAEKWKSFGWDVVEIDGHHIASIVKALHNSGRSGKPTAIIAHTLKGKGVSFLENKDGKHGVPLSKEEMDAALQELEMKPVRHKIKLNRPAKAQVKKSSIKVKAPGYKIGEKAASRDGFGNALAKIGSCSELYVVDPAVGNSTRANKFLDKYPERFVQVGIQEQNAVGIATGLSKRGKEVFVGSFGAFLTRCYDQVRMASYSKANIKVFGTHSGVSIGEDGPSQMGLEDFSMMRALDECVVLSPGDATSAEALSVLAAKKKGMFYLRLAREKTPVIYGPDEEFKVGGCKVLKSSGGDFITIVATGFMVHEALKAYEILKKKGLGARIIDVYSVKPLPAEELKKNAMKTRGLVLTLEDHRLEGGFGEAVSSALNSRRFSVHSLGVTKTPLSAPPSDQLKHQGLDADSIVKKALSLWKNK